MAAGPGSGLAVACVVPSVLWPRHPTTQRHLRTLNFQGETESVSQSVSQSGDWGLQEATNNNLLPLTLTDHNTTKYTRPARVNHLVYLVVGISFELDLNCVKILICPSFINVNKTF